MDDLNINKPLQRFWRLMELEKKDLISIYLFSVLSGLINLSLPLGVQSIIWRYNKYFTCGTCIGCGGRSSLKRLAFYTPNESKGKYSTKNIHKVQFAICL